MVWLIEIIIVGVGGMSGVVSRYLVYESIETDLGFPIETLSVNVLGSFLLGCLSSLNLGFYWTRFFASGVIGSFTTFSTFSFELYQFNNQNRYLKSVVYAVISLVLSLIAIFLSNKLVNWTILFS